VSWTRLTDGSNGIPADFPTRVVREDPDREGLLYAGTEFGMYLSFDDGANWQPFQMNLPHTPITDIKLAHGDLILATQGRGFWILDNLAPLRQVTETVAAAAQQEAAEDHQPGERARRRLDGVLQIQHDRSGPAVPQHDVRDAARLAV